MRTVNKVILLGTAGSDPDGRTTSSGKRVAYLSIATNRVFMRDGDEQRRTDWHRLVFHGVAADEVTVRVRRGTAIYVEGRIEYGAYDREGLSIPTVEIIVQDFDIISDEIVP